MDGGDYLKVERSDQQDVLSAECDLVLPQNHLTDICAKLQRGLSKHFTCFEVVLQHRILCGEYQLILL